MGPRTQESGNVCHLRMVNVTPAALSAGGQDQTRAGGVGPLHTASKQAKQAEEAQQAKASEGKARQGTKI